MLQHAAAAEQSASLLRRMVPSTILFLTLPPDPVDRYFDLSLVFLRLVDRRT